LPVRSAYAGCSSGLTVNVRLGAAGDEMLEHPTVAMSDKENVTAFSAVEEVAAAVMPRDKGKGDARGRFGRFS
jgi:hypothetical protein